MGLRTSTMKKMAMHGAPTRRVRGPIAALGVPLIAAIVLALAPSLGLGAARAQTAPTLPTTPPVGGVDACHHGGGVLTAEDRAAIRALVIERLQQRLGLVDQQAEELRAILQAQQEVAREAVDALCQAREELRSLMAWPEADPAALRAATDKVKAAHARLLERRLDGHLELRARLTAAEWAQWVELMGPRGY
jgi:Spy/CpxP family protein refolding chaperone